MNKAIKQGLSTLQRILQDEDTDDYILITKEKVVFKNQVFTKAGGVWVDDNVELSDVLLGVNLINQDEEDEDEIPKKKVSGKPASQERIKEAIIKFYNDNLSYNIEDFSEFSVILNKEDRIENLKNIFNTMSGRASESVYKSFIELELLHQLYLKNFGKKEEKNLVREDLSSIITTKKKASIYFKKVSNFYFICKHLNKGSWKECGIAPTYWESVTGPTWKSIIEILNLEQQQNKDSEEGEE
jgi:hypothetical protein